MTAPLAVLLAFDRRVHARLEAWSAPFAVSALLRSCSTLGDGWMWVAGVAVIVRVAPRPWSDLASVAAVGAVVNLLIVALKTTVRRRRPAAYMPNAFLTATVGGPPDCDRFSFPSGHAANAVALAVVLGHTFPTARAALLLTAALVGGSRVVLGHHYLTDMVAGGIVGVIASAAAGLVAPY